MTFSRPLISDVTPQQLCLGPRSSPRKVIHHESCRHAREPYVWARRHRLLSDVVAALMAGGGWRWHVACRSCLPDLDAWLEGEAAARRAVLRGTTVPPWGEP